MVTRFVVTAIILYSLSSDAFSQWAHSRLPDGGTITRIYADGPTLLVASPRGLYASTDNGDHWVHRGDYHAYVGYVYSLIRKGRSLFASTSDRSVIRSTDEGVHWHDADSLMKKDHYSFALYDVDSALIAATSRYIYSTTDEGQSWKIICDRRQSFHIYTLFGLDSAIFAGMYGGVSVSTDGGKQWEILNDGIPVDDLCLVTNVCSIGNSLFISILVKGIYRSSNRGKTWESITIDLSNDPIERINSDGSHLYAATSNGRVIRSSNEGMSWQDASNGLPVNNYVFQILPVEGNIFLTSNGGIYCSSDHGSTWQLKDNGIDESSIHSFLQIESSILAGTYEGGVIRSTDLGRSWKHLGDATRFGSVNSIRQVDHELWATTYQSGVYKSIDEGESWIKADNGLEQDAKKHYGSSYPVVSSIDSYGNQLIASTNKGFYASSNRGADWKLWDTISLKSMTARNITYSGSKLFACTMRNIWFSVDSGKTWLMRNFVPPPDRSLRNLKYCGSNLYLTVEGPSLYRSTDDGMSFEKIYSYEKNYSSAFECDNSLLILALIPNLLLSTDAGNTWRDISPPFVNVNSDWLRIPFLYKSASDTILFGYSNREIWKYQISKSSIVSAPTSNQPNDFSLLQNYPNPFSAGLSRSTIPSFTTIEYNLPKATSVRLSVHDVLGREVKVVVDALQTAGKHQVVLQGKELLAGTYIYRLQTPTTSLSRMMTCWK